MELLNKTLIRDYLSNNHTVDEYGNKILEPVKYRGHMVQLIYT